jgi:two-component system, cell cycle response regulator
VVASPALGMQLWVASSRTATRANLLPALEQGGWVCTLFDDGAAVMRRLDAEPPDALLLEDPLGSEDALAVLARLRISEARIDLPVVVLAEGQEAWVQALELGADDVLAPSVAPAELLARLSRRRALKLRTDALLVQGERLERMALTDGLTQIHNRRYFQLRLAEEFRRAQRYDNPLALILADLDHFKTVNDTAGHQVGDTVLRQVAGCFQACIRDTDTAARWGGEEFAVVLPQTHLAGALTVAERIRRDVGALRLGPSSGVSVTASLGVSSYPAAHVHTTEELVRAADEALYRAKRDGRNRVCLTDPAGPDTQPTPSA